MASQKDIQRKLDFLTTALIEFGAYLFSVLGVLFSEYIPALRKSLAIDLDMLIPSLPKVIGAAMVAIVVTFFIEDTESDKITGIKSRFARHFLFGIAWAQIFSSIIG